MAHIKSAGKTRLIKNFLSLVGLRGAELIVPLLAVPYLLRTIGVEKYGLINVGYAFAVYFGAVVQYGFGVTVTRDIARNRQDMNIVGRIYATALSCSALIALLVLVLALIAILVFPQLRGHWVLYSLSLMQAVAQSMFPAWVFQGLERMGYITYLGLASKVAFLVGVLLVVRGPDDYLYVPLLGAVSAATVFVSSLAMVRRNFELTYKIPDWAEVRRALFEGRHAFVSQFAPSLYNNSTIFLLGITSGANPVGIYTAAAKVSDAVSSLAYILSTTFLPFLSRSLENYRAFKNVMILLGFACAGFLYLSADAVSIFLIPGDGVAFAGILKLMSIGVFAVFAIQTFGANYLMLIRKERVAGRISAVTSVSFFFVALVLVPSYGLTGAIATLLSARACLALAFYLTYRANRATQREGADE